MSFSGAVITGIRVCVIFVGKRYDIHAKTELLYVPDNIEQRRAIIEFAPRVDQRIPDCFRRFPMTCLQPASITPLPTNNPIFLNSAYYIREAFVLKYPISRSIMSFCPLSSDDNDSNSLTSDWISPFSSNA